MEQLPLEIEQKIADLPIIPFDGSKDFENLIMSADFTAIFNFYKENYLPDVLKTKPEIYQRVSLYLALTNQDSSFIEQTDNVIYRRPVPTIEEFLDNPRYLGLQNQNMYSYWRKQLCEIFKPNTTINRVLWSGATGTGKGLLLTDYLPTPAGYKQVKDLKVGDYLWGKNGKPTKILKIFDRGLQNVYKVSFDDASFVICDEDHLWQIDTYKKKRLKTPKVFSVKELINKGITYHSKSEKIDRYKFKIPVCDAVEYPEKKYDIHPYILGALLGDGYLNLTPIIANHIKDKFIVERIKSLLPDEYTISKYPSHLPKHEDTPHYGIVRKENNATPFNHYYRKLNLFKTTSYTKFIPDIYKFGSVEQRYELLRGLLDTDGTIQIGKNRTISSVLYGTVSLQLAKDVIEIVRSLGGRAKLSKVNRLNRVSKKEYIQYIVMISCLQNPFALPRKAAKFNIKKVPGKVITGIEKLDKQQETRCFVVEADDHLFLCNDYIVTHNTVTARKAIIYSLYRLLCLRYPRAVLNVESGSTLACFILSVTQKTAYQTNFEPFIRILEGMPCFQRVRNVVAFDNFDLDNPKMPFPFYVDKSNLTIVFKDNFILTLGSQISNTVGYDVVLSAADEVNELGVQAGMELLNSIDGRVQGRFSGSPFIGSHVMSSARSTDSVTREYVKKWKNDPGFLYLHPMRFEVKASADFTSDSKFPLLIGNGSIASKIITDPGELRAIEENKYITPAGCELIQVPDLYLPQFKSDLTQSIQDILGIDTSANNFVFRDTTSLEDSTLMSEISLEANIRDNTDLLSLLPAELFEQNLNGKWQWKRAPFAKRYCHLDLSSGGSNGQCDSGVCILHKEWQLNPVTNVQDVIYVVDLLLYVNAKVKIDLNAIQTLMLRLGNERGANIHTISADQYQCLVGDTLIDLLDGRKLTIKEIAETYDKNDYYTYTYDTTNKKIVPGKVVGGLKTGHKQVYKVTLDNGEEIKCTEDHLFLLRDCTYKKAKDLTPDDSLMALHENIVKIVSIEKLGFEDVYDIQIDNFPNFALSSGVFVHNSLILLESLEASGCFEEVNKVSVDIKLEPYLNASRLIETGNVKVGKCPKLIKELEALILVKGKVTRTTELKDGADALVGAIYNAQLNYRDVPTAQYVSFEKKKCEFDYNDLIDVKTQELASI